jgi:aconitate hydratase 2/2-methylisocitrate dehydratase
VEPGVSKSAKVKAGWLKSVALSEVGVSNLSPSAAVALLAEMGGGYNVEVLVELLEVEAVAVQAAEGL